MKLFGTKEIPYPDTNEIPDAEHDGLVLAEYIAKLGKAESGTTAARPAASARSNGDMYIAIDGTEYRIWQIVNGAWYQTGGLGAIHSENLANLSVTANKLGEDVNTANNTNTSNIAANTSAISSQGSRISTLESGREPIPNVITHTGRGMDLPASPRWGERVIIAVEPASFSAEIEAARVNRPIWEFVYYGRWYFVGGIPIVAFHVENQTIAGNGTWQVLAPVVYAPYPRMVARVHYGAQFGALGGITVHGTIGTSLTLGTTAAQGPGILTLNNAIATLSTMAWAQWWFNSSEEYLAHFGACTSAYEHGFRYTEIIPIEIIP